ncbi:Hypothetical_protein [Hexamita inflata]|uniref:Hypothetical_protein n=1 Tax=Hexamita inflata TaxID=28002 RepID=A0AA86TK00_9EUKA|nr:Hypothetical protein HINF_LOCUS5612 [Hexamita inflata]
MKENCAGLFLESLPMSSTMCLSGIRAFILSICFCSFLSDSDISQQSLIFRSKESLGSISWLNRVCQIDQILSYTNTWLINIKHFSLNLKSNFVPQWSYNCLFTNVNLKNIVLRSDTLIAYELKVCRILTNSCCFTKQSTIGSTLEVITSFSTFTSYSGTLIGATEGSLLTFIYSTIVSGFGGSMLIFYTTTLSTLGCSLIFNLTFSTFGYSTFYSNISYLAFYVSSVLLINCLSFSVFYSIYTKFVKVIFQSQIVVSLFGSLISFCSVSGFLSFASQTGCAVILISLFYYTTYQVTTSFSFFTVSTDQKSLIFNSDLLLITFQSQLSIISTTIFSGFFSIFSKLVVLTANYCGALLITKSFQILLWLTLSLIESKSFFLSIFCTTPCMYEIQSNFGEFCLYS